MNGYKLLWISFLSLDCGVLSIPNGKVTEFKGTYIDSVAAIECDRGYELNGTSFARCLMTDKGVTWSYSATCEIQGIQNKAPNMIFCFYRHFVTITNRLRPHSLAQYKKK